MSSVPNGPEANGSTIGASSGTDSAQNAGPVTNRTVSPEHHKRKLIRKLSGPSPLKHTLWLAGHGASLGFGLVTVLFLVLRLQNRFYISTIAYRLLLLGLVVALTATMSHKFGLRFLPPMTALVAHQNFQYLILAVIWLFSFKSVFKLIPYFLISLLQLAAHKKVDVILKLAPLLASVIAFDELFLIVYLALRTVLFRSTAGYQLTAFLVFYWLRILYNKETTNLFGALVERLDGKVGGVKNEQVQHIWNRTKMFIREKQESH